MSETEAYLAITNPQKEITRESAKVLGSRLMEAYGLDDARLAQELDLRLKANTERFFKDESLGIFDDNATRMRATELLSDFLKKREKGDKVNVNTSVAVGNAVHIYLPENDRDKPEDADGNN